MDKRRLIVVLGLLAAAGCRREADEAATRVQEPTAPVDNTGVNVRDRAGTLPTAADQSENKADIDLAAAIRKAVTSDEAMSSNAKNVKIIVQSGEVTLRGPVDSAAEKTAIVTKATDIAGRGRVVDQLEVASKPAGTAEPQVPSRP